MTAEEILKDKAGDAWEFTYNCEVVPVDYAKDFARLKCQELLEIVAEKAKTKTIWESDGQPSSSFPDSYYEVIDKDSILNAVDLNSFIS
jgi:hypothetical protein